jgi:hypothetical protein
VPGSLVGEGVRHPPRPEEDTDGPKRATRTGVLLWVRQGRPRGIAQVEAETERELGLEED